MSNRIRKQAKQLSKTQNNQLLEQSITVEKHSILPPPDDLERYEKLNPGTAKILMETFQKQVEHRINIETSVINANTDKAKRGQVLGFILCLTAIIGGTILICFDKDIYGLAAIITAITSLVIVFVTGTNAKKKERIEKDKLNK